MEDTKGSLVFAAIAALHSDLAKIGIDKLGVNSQQHFNFRAIDDMYAVIGPLIPKNNLVLLPSVVDVRREERTTKSGSIQMFTLVKVQYSFISTIDASRVDCVYVGEAADTGDKATSKALTMSFKYFLLHGLCIPLKGMDDGDKQTVEESVPDRREAPPSPAAEIISDEIVKQALPAMRAATDDTTLNAVYAQAIRAAEASGVRDSVAALLTPEGKKLRASLSAVASKVG